MAYGGLPPGTVVVWQWMNDEGDWALYEAPVSNYIEDCYSSSRGVVRLGDVDQSLHHLTVDIRQMVQKSTNGGERPVRRELCDGNSAVARGALWQWGKERVHRNVRQYAWHSYSMDAANMLEAAYSSSGANGYVDLDVSPVNEPYVVDLNTMQQINKSSGFSRPVQRLRNSGSYRTVSSVRPSGHRSSWLAPGSSGTLMSGLGRSTQSLVSVGRTPVALSNPPFAGSGMQSAANGSNFNFANSSGGVQFGAGAPGNAPGAGFSFQAPHPVGQPPFAAPHPVGQPPFAAPAPGTVVRRAKRVRTLRQNLTPGASIGAAPTQAFPFGAQPLSSNWPVNTVPALNVQQSAASSSWAPNINSNLGNLPQNLASSRWSVASNASHGSNASAFSTWRNVPSQPINGSNSNNSAGTGNNSLGQSQPVPQFPQSVVSSASSSSNSGNNSGLMASAVSSLISGFSKMLSVPYRYITTGGSSNASNVPAQPQDTVTPSTSKVGARSMGSTGQNAKRRKLMGEDRIMQDDLSLVQKLTARDVLGNYIIEVPRPPQKEDCCICCDSLREASGYGQGDSYTVVRLVKCQHMFHMDCLSAMYDSSSKNGSVQCPNCKVIYGTKYGNCPNGMMIYKILDKELSGFPGTTTFEIQYHINPGQQSDVHPNPGRPYKIRGFPRVCYLPNNQEGQKVLELLVVAWKRRLTFTIGTSVTTGEPDVVVWNEIHHKTEMDNIRGHGYPDPNYLSNVLAELASQGVTDDDSQ